MSGNSLDYTILKKDKIVTQSGNIINIMQKVSMGFVVDSGTFDFEIKLKNKAIVHMVDYKPTYAQMIGVELFSDRDTVVQSIHRVNDPPEKADYLVFKESAERKAVTTKLKITLTNKVDLNAGIGLIYLIIRGQKIQEKTKNKSISVKKDEFFDDAHLSVHKKPVSVRQRQQKEVFSNRKKTRSPETEKDINIARNLKKNDEEYQIHRAIQLSKQEARKNQNKQIGFKQDSRMVLNSQPRQYSKVDFSKYKHIFQYVNPTWLEAQRNVESEKGVKDSERLSKVIQVRHFNNKTVCLDVPFKEKTELDFICREMGAIMKDSPCDFCILITSKVDTEKVAKAKKMKHVKILKPSFIRECKQCQAYLDQKDYFHKL